MAPRPPRWPRPRLLGHALLLLGGTLPPAAAFWGRGSQPTAPATPWDQPCVDMMAECVELADGGECDGGQAAAMQQKCCQACAVVGAADEHFGCSPSSGRTITTLVDHIAKACLQGSDTLFMQSECTSATRTPCKDALVLLTDHAVTEEGKACNAFMFKKYPDIAVYWGACNKPQAPSSESVEVRNAQALSDALGRFDSAPITVFGDVDYTGYYDEERDKDPYDDLAVQVGWGNPVQLRGSAVSLHRASLAARFYVFYGTLSLRKLRLVEPAFEHAPDGAVIFQRGGAVTIRDCVIQTSSPYVYGHAVLTAFGEILVRSTNVEVPIRAAKKNGVDSSSGGSCTRPSNMPALGDDKCLMAIDELRISDGEFIATGTSPVAPTCPGGSELDAATAKCVYGADAVTTECPRYSKQKVDAVGKAIEGRCTIESVECPSGATLHADGTKCIRRVVESPVDEAGGAGSECPAGSERQGDTCVYSSLVCPAGSSFKKGAAGEEYCIVDTAPECPEGSSVVEVDGTVRCTWDATACPAGSQADEDGKCMKEAHVLPPPPPPPAPPSLGCPSGSALVGDNCEITAVRCPEGAELDGRSGDCISDNVQFRTSHDGYSAELFPCKLNLIDALIAQGLFVGFLKALQGILPGCGIGADRICVCLLTILCWNIFAFVFHYCKCGRLCKGKGGKQQSTGHYTTTHGMDPLPEKIMPGVPDELPYRPMQPTRGMLTVTNISCSDLIAADPNGKSDPYVKLALSNRDLTENGPVNAQEQQTDVQHKTLHPKFDERFRFHINTTTVLPDLDLVLMDKDMATFDDYLGQVKIDLHSFFDSRDDWTYPLGPMTVEFELADPKKLVSEDHWREREELLHARGDLDSPQLGTVTLTLEFTPQKRGVGSPRRDDSYAGSRSPSRLAGTGRSTRSPYRGDRQPEPTPLHVYATDRSIVGSGYGGSPGRPLGRVRAQAHQVGARGYGGSPRRDRHRGRLEAEEYAAQNSQRGLREPLRSTSTHRSRSPVSRRLTPDGDDERAWREEAGDALDGEWEAIGDGSEVDHVQLKLQQDLSITGVPAPAGPDTERFTIRFGMLKPPVSTGARSPNQSGGGGFRWFRRRGSGSDASVELGTVSFVQRFDDTGEETNWTGTLFSSEGSGAAPYMDGHWSGSCVGSFRAEKRTGRSRRLSGGGMSVTNISSVYGGGSVMGDPLRTPGSMRLSPTATRRASYVDRPTGTALQKGTLHAKLLRAEGLITADKHGKVNSGYAKLQLFDSVGDTIGEIKKSNAVANEREPQWDEIFDFHIDSMSSSGGAGPLLKVTLMDGNTFLSDAFLGVASVDIAEIFGGYSMGGSPAASIEEDFELEDPETKVSKENFERRKAELRTARSNGHWSPLGLREEHDNPYGYVRLKLTFIPDEE